jgi:replicative DNA helicase
MTAHLTIDSTSSLPVAIEAEQALLGALLLSNQMASGVATIVDRSHFAEELHAAIFGAISDLISTGRQANTTSVALALGGVELPAGAPPIGEYLARITCNAVTIRDAPGWALMVRDTAHRRRIIALAGDLIAAARDASISASGASILEPFNDGVRDIEEARGLEPAESAGDMAERFVQEIGAARVGDYVVESFTTGFERLDALTRYRPGEVVVTAGRPGQGKSIMATAAARRIAQSGIGVLEFPLENGKEQAVARHLADMSYSRAKPIHYGWIIDRDIRDMGDDDRIRRAANKLAEIPLIIDDAERITITRLSSRIKQEKSRLAAAGVRLGVVELDHLDFIDATDRYAGNRTQEIGEIMKGLKAIARKERVVIHLFCQLNRGVEGRDDKRPQLADLRNCLPGSAMVLCAKTGRKVPIREIVEKREGACSIAVGMASNMKLSRKEITDAWAVGIKPVFKVTTRTGRVLRCTSGHRLFGEAGWEELQELSVGDSIAVPRITPEPSHYRSDISEDQALLLGLMLGDGYFGGSPALALAPDDDKEFFVEIGRRAFGLSPHVRNVQGGNSVVIYSMGGLCGAGKNPFTAWLRGLSLWGVRGENKFIPECVFQERNHIVASVLRGLFHSDGCYKARPHNSGEAVFCSISEVLVRGVQRALTRLGIISTVSHEGRESSGFRPSTSRIWAVSIRGEQQLRLFAEAVGFLGSKQDKIADALLTRKPARNGATDRLPPCVNRLISAARRSAGLSHARLGWRDQGKAPSRETALMVAEKLGSDEIRNFATSDVLWDEIVSIEEDGAEETFDLTVADIHNFIVDDFFTHNSGDIEQVADVVNFLYREAYYLERSADVVNCDPLALGELERVKNEVDVITAKSRTSRIGTTKLFIEPCASFISGRA